MIRYITCGESHGKGMGIIIEGFPSGLKVDIDFINNELARRQKGYGRGDRMKIETDKVEFISGLSNGKTTGSPVLMIIWNKDYENWKNKEIEPILKPRPGHADLIGAYKYNHTDDMRKVLERSSARETAARVAGGALIKLLLKEFDINIFSYVVNYGGIEIDVSNLDLNEIKKRVNQSDIGTVCDKETEDKIKKLIDDAKKTGDTIGGIIEVVIEKVPAMLGSYQDYNRKLDALIAKSVLSVQGIKGIEFGIGFKYARTPGKYAHDEIFYDRVNNKYFRKTNNCGGIEGGMSNGNNIVFRAVMKPIPTLMSPLKTVNIKTKEEEVAVKERSDVVALLACGVVLENVVAFDIANALLERYGSDNMDLIKQNYINDKNKDLF